MRFYKLTDVETSDDLYVNPKIIEFYTYSDKGVIIHTNKYTMHVDKSDFTNMLILEGIDEYWHTPQFIEFQLITEIELFY